MVVHHSGVLFWFGFLKTVSSLSMILLGRAGFLFALRNLKLREATWPAKAHQILRIPRRASPLASQFKPFHFPYTCASQDADQSILTLFIPPYLIDLVVWEAYLRCSWRKRSGELLQSPLWGSGRKPAWNSYLVVPEVPWASKGFSLSGQTFTITLWSM